MRKQWLSKQVEGLVRANPSFFVSLMTNIFLKGLFMAMVKMVPKQLRLPFGPPIATDNDKNDLITLLCILDDVAPNLDIQSKRTIFNWLEILDPLIYSDDF